MQPKKQITRLEITKLHTDFAQMLVDQEELRALSAMLHKSALRNDSAEMHHIFVHILELEKKISVVEENIKSIGKEFQSTTATEE